MVKFMGFFHATAFFRNQLDLCRAGPVKVNARQLRFYDFSRALGFLNGGRPVDRGLFAAFSRCHIFSDGFPCSARPIEGSNHPSSEKVL